MFRIASKLSLATATTLASLLVLSACGGGGSSTNATPPDTQAPPPGPVEITLATSYTPISSAASASKPNWPDWNHPGTDAVGGVGCYKVVNYHIHALLSIYRDGVRLAVPGSIGRNADCDYELHTHEGSGTIHIEAVSEKSFTLGQFFALWGQPLSDASVAGLPGKPTYFVIENEKITRVTTNPADIPLSAHKEIVVITGTPPREVPKYDWGTSGL
jgi:hypothetical protein